MKPYAMSATSRRRVASICPPPSRFALLSTARLAFRLQRQRGVPDPRPARGRRPRGAGPGRRPEAARPARRAAARGRRGACRPTAWSPRCGARTRRGTPSARCGPTCRGCGRCCRNGCGGGRRATRSTSPTASSTPPSSARLVGLARERAAAGDHRRGGRPPRHRARPVARRGARRVRPRRDRRATAGSRAWPTCASPPSRSGRRRCSRWVAGGRSSPSWRRWSSATPTARPWPPCSCTRSTRADGRPTRWPSTRRCAAASSTSWASSRPTPPARLHRRVLEQDPALAPGRRRPAHQPAAPGQRAGRAGPGDRRGRGRAADGPAGHAASASGASGRPGSRSRWRAASATGSPTAPGSPSWPRSADGGSVAHAVAAALRRAAAARRDDRADGRRVPRRPLAAARAGQLRARAGRRRAAGAAPRRAVPRRRRARHEPGAARRRRASRCGRCRRCRSRTPRRCSCCARGPPAPTSTPTSAAVAEICRRVDGLPLGIELAAARTRAMSAAEIAARLDDGHLLARGARTAQPRHQSLAAAIDWSYRLLDGRRAAAVRADVGVRGRRRPRRRARRLRRAGHVPGRVARPRGRARGQVDGRGGRARRASPATACWRPCGPTRGSDSRREAIAPAARRVLRRPRRGGRPRRAGRRRARLDRGDAAERGQPPGRVRVRASPSATPTSPCAWSRRCPR